MSSSKISDLAAATALADTDLFVIAQEDTANKKLPWSTFQGLGAAYARIDEKVVGVGGQATIDFTSIPGTFRGLRISWVGQTEGASAENLLVRFNNDSGSNYTWAQADVMAGGTANSTGTSGVIGVLSATGDTNPCLGEIVIGGYKETTFTKVARGATHGFYSASHRMPLSHVFWTTAAITRVTLFATSDVKEGSIFTLDARV